MFSKNIIVLLVLVFCTEYLSAEEEILVDISDGTIKGRVEVTITNTTFYSFQGIPYAQPPLRELRFQAPRPVQPWADVLDATAEKYTCFQVPGDRPDENEDCLFINVFTPQNPRDESPSEPLPVMVFIYGGGFVEGSSESVNYGPQHLIEYGVILVTFNYRVGPFGFFTTGDDVIPGNAGLKDQNLALQWVQKNIKFFKGDPEKVTIFGESAGAASVAYQILSPKSKGLFRAAIGESGSALSPWAYQRNQLNITYQTVSILIPNFSPANVTNIALFQHLSTLPARVIDAASHALASRETDDYIQIQQGFFYAPIVEHEHEGAFITKNMYELLESGEFTKVPLLIGFNSQESLFMTNDPTSLNYTARYFDEHHNLLVPLDLHIHEAENVTKASEEIKSLYTKDTFAEDPIKLVSYFSDQSFIRSIIKHAELQSNFTDVYLYRFAYSGVLGNQVTEPVEGFSDSVRHGEELGYLFRRNYGGYNTTDLSQYPESDVQVLKRFSTMFTNFAKTLNPTPEEDELLDNVLWPKVSPDFFPYLDIGSYSRVSLHPQNHTYSAWETIYDKYGEGPFDTY